MSCEFTRCLRRYQVSRLLSESPLWTPNAKLSPIPPGSSQRSLVDGRGQLWRQSSLKNLWPYHGVDVMCHRAKAMITCSNFSPMWQSIPTFILWWMGLGLKKKPNSISLAAKYLIWQLNVAANIHFYKSHEQATRYIAPEFVFTLMNMKLCFVSNCNESLYRQLLLNWSIVCTMGAVC